MTSDNANYPKKRDVRKPMMNYGDEDSDSSATSSSSGPEITFSAVKKLKKQRQSRISAALEQHESGDQSSSKNLQKRMRRRSSARFLRLSYSENNNSKDLLSESSSATREDLGNMYKTVMKLNNENKINATNSWGLKLIENLDKVLEYDEENVERDASENNQSSRIINGNNEERGINFTKASCTLDASVKIYSYRVDDAHLTSYKVLANLNRTESSNSNKNGAAANHQDGEEITTNSTKKGEKQRTATDTIESNLSNINMNKLDSAYDIDPLFHKMSKKFDEGGAKGLLLANLDIAMDSCAIVFDSKDDNYSLDELKPPAEEASQNIKQLDVSSLVSNLRSLLNGVSIQSIPLVPQLESLREEYKQLDAEGHIVSDDQLPRVSE
jgi:condensin complex subunit 2